MESNEHIWSCYILRSLDMNYPNYTYIGITNNHERRLRQHNGELFGGAKYTRSKRPYKIYCMITGFKTKSEALKYEYRIKHPSKKRSGIDGKITTLIEHLKIQNNLDGLKIITENRYIERFIDVNIDIETFNDS